MHSGLSVKAFAFFPSPCLLLSFLHIFAPFFTPNWLKSGLLQWGEGRKTKNGCDTYARSGTFTSRVHLVRSFFVHPVLHLARGANMAPTFSRMCPSFRRKTGEAFSVLPTAVGDRRRARSFAACPSPKGCPTKRKPGCENHYLSLALPRKSFIFAAKHPSRSSRDAAFPPV